MKYIFKGKADISDTSTADITTDEKVTCPADSFFNKRGGNVLLALENAKKPRRNLSSIIAGKAITEQDVFEKIQAYNEKTENSSKGKGKGKENNKLAEHQKPGSSNTQRNTAGPSKAQNASPGPFLGLSDESDHESIADEEKCCVCDKLEPEQLKFKPYIEFVRWGQCHCGHWVHLSYCIKEKVIRRDTQITCPHCA